MKRFETYIDLKDIRNTLELDSGDDVAWLQRDGYNAVCRVCGSVRVLYNDDVYKSACQMPEELLQIIHEGRTEESGVEVVDSNWLEVLIYDKDWDWTGYGEVVDWEGVSEDEVFKYLNDCIDEYIEDTKK